MPRAQAHGVELDYETYGPSSGRPLVLIRGLGTQRTQWPSELLVALVGEGHHVVGFDNRDAGLSSRIDAAGVPDVARALAQAARGEPVAAPYLLGDMARDVVGLLDALGIDSAHVVGISMGGMIAQLLAADHAERIRSLTSIMSTSGEPGLPGPTPEARAALLSVPADPEDREEAVRRHVAHQYIMGSPGFRPGEDYWRAEAERSFDRVHDPMGPARQLVATIASGSRAESLARIRIPTLVIHGEDDPLIPIECGQDTARRIPGARFLAIPGMGHDINPRLVPILVPAISRHTRAADGATATVAR